MISENVRAINDALDLKEALKKIRDDLARQCPNRDDSEEDPYVNEISPHSHMLNLAKRRMRARRKAHRLVIEWLDTQIGG